MGLKIHFDENMLLELKEMLYSPKYSKKEICKYFNVSEDVIDRLRKENNFVYNRKEKQYEEYIFTEKQLEVLQGCLLGDGCLSIHKNSKNANFSYTSKSKEMVEYVYQYFKDLVSSEDIKYSEIYDKRTDKVYTQYRIRTIVHPAFTEIYYKWYIDGDKHIPKDLVLTPTICLFWYLGDGSLSNTGHTSSLNFETHCFNKKEIETVLMSQLKEYSPTLLKVGVSKNGDEQYRLYIYRAYIQQFLDYIGSCPVNYYAYKWYLKPYKNTPPLNHKDKGDIFVELYKNGKTCYEIAKEHGIEINAVKFYIKKAGIYQPKERDKTNEKNVFSLLESGNTVKEIRQKLNMKLELVRYYKRKWLNEKS